MFLTGQRAHNIPTNFPQPRNSFKLWFPLRLNTPHDHCWNFVPQDAPKTRFESRKGRWRAFYFLLSFWVCLFVYFPASSLEIFLFGGHVSKPVLRGQDQNLRSADGKKKKKIRPRAFQDKQLPPEAKQLISAPVVRVCDNSASSSCDWGYRCGSSYTLMLPLVSALGVGDLSKVEIRALEGLCGDCLLVFFV